MSWRTVVIGGRAKLELKLDSMVVRGDEVVKIHLSEISTLIIENTAVSMTSALLCELINRKVKVIFCDENRNPVSELVPYYGSHDASARVKMQLAWTDYTKAAVWTAIVRDKIEKQREILRSLHKEEEALLCQYLSELSFNDATNREGHAAKVYFNAVFGLQFSRSQENSINAALNYGYTILLSAFNREIVSNGCITQIGIFHDNIFNHFNLGSDLMEPFRPIVDMAVYKLQPEKFEKQEKSIIVNILNQRVYIDGKEHYVNNAIRIYCKSVLEALNENDISLMRFYRNEL